MAKGEDRLYYEDLVGKIRTKFPVHGVWYVTLNVKDAALVIWKHEDPDPVSLGILLKTITNTTKVLEVLAMKDGGGFVRLSLDPKYLDRQVSKTALGGGLLSADRNQISVVINEVLRKQPNYKLLERESIKGALNAGLFRVLPKAAAHYLPHPEVATKVAPRTALVARVDTDSEEEREIARDVKASQRHEAQRMAVAKEKFTKERGSQSKSQSSKDKGKLLVQEAPKKKPSVPTQAHREKLLGSSMAAQAAETTRLSRESKTDSNKRKRETHVTPPPPPQAAVVETSESEQAGSEESDKGSDSGSKSPPPSQPVGKRGAKLKTLKQMDN
ncbi:hypothetical protein R1sor_019995 [Riccia sorocarpa]|uniref:Uncharacterized protein n=1 Tax=Riccia sorocarpa TaxID=122646 RepID=A0ABD3IE70_9MARC